MVTQIITPAAFQERVSMISKLAKAKRPDVGYLQWMTFFVRTFTNLKNHNELSDCVLAGKWPDSVRLTMLNEDLETQLKDTDFENYTPPMPHSTRKEGGRYLRRDKR